MDRIDTIRYDSIRTCRLYCTHSINYFGAFIWGQTKQLTYATMRQRNGRQTGGTSAKNQKFDCGSRSVDRSCSIRVRTVRTSYTCSSSLCRDTNSCVQRSSGMQNATVIRRPVRHVLFYPNGLTDRRKDQCLCGDRAQPMGCGCGCGLDTADA